MEANIKIAFDDGTVLEGIAKLSVIESGRSESREIVRRPKPDLSHGVLDFSTPIRPFVKRHATTAMSGPRKLTLLIARLADGKTDVSVYRAEVERSWSKMEGLLGGPYNGAYDTRARDQGWIYSPKAGVFALRPGWEAVLK